MKNECAICDSKEGLQLVRIAEEGLTTDYRTFCTECNTIFEEATYIRYRDTTHLYRFGAINAYIRKVRKEKDSLKSNLQLF